MSLKWKKLIIETGEMNKLLNTQFEEITTWLEGRIVLEAGERMDITE